MSDAETLGWGDRWRAHLEVAAMETGEDLAAGRVIAVHRGTVEVAILSGARDSAAHGFRTVDLGARGHSTGDAVWPPVVGDWVGLRHVETPAPVIAAVLPRRRILGARRRRGGRSGSPSLRTSMSSSSSNPWTRLPPSGVWRGSPRYRGPPGPEAWLVLTKTDLVAPGIVEETLTGMGPWVDAAVGVTSADPASTERLRTLLPKGATAVLVGRSGAGKSTLLNTILGVGHATGEVRSSDSEGRLDSERLGRYQRMLRESARLAARSDARHAREQERRASRNDSRGRRGVMRLTGC